MAEGEVHLSDAQLDVMRAVWALGSATTAEVYRQAGRPRSVAYTTIATTLARLEKRGLVRSVKDDAGERVFEPLVSEGEVTRSMVSSLVASLFQGDPRALVSHLVKQSEVKEGDLETLRRMLEEDGKS
jgi:predicted transcriptional regulator